MNAAEATRLEQESARASYHLGDRTLVPASEAYNICRKIGLPMLAIPLINRILALETAQQLGVPVEIYVRLAALEKTAAQVETLTTRIKLLEKEHDELAARVDVLYKHQTGEPFGSVRRVIAQLQSDVANLKLKSL